MKVTAHQRWDKLLKPNVIKCMAYESEKSYFCLLINNDDHTNNVVT
jgi:hypothetical protein